MILLLIYLLVIVIIMYLYITVVYFVIKDWEFIVNKKMGIKPN